MNNKDFVNGMFFGVFIGLIIGLFATFIAGGPPSPSFTKMLDEWHDEAHKP